MRPTIFLVNQISRHGHLDLYARIYSACLLDLGFRVVLLAEHEPGTLKWLTDHSVENREHFVFLKREDLHRAHHDKIEVSKEHNVRDVTEDGFREAPVACGEAPTGEITDIRLPLWARARRVWNEEGARGIALRCKWYARTGFVRLGLLVVQPARIIRSGVSKALRKGFNFLSESGRRGSLLSVFAQRVVTVLEKLKRIWDGRGAGVDFVTIVDEIRLAQQRVGKPDFIFFLYLDMMSEGWRGCRYLSKNIDSPWAGILFHPRYDGPKDTQTVERYLRARNARGAAFLNPRSIAPYRARLRSRKFGVLPDVTDFTVAPHEVELVTRLRAAAGGRTTVLLIGSLAPHKGLLPFIEVVRRADPKKFFFAIVGELFWESYGSHKQFLREFAENPPGHCFFEPGYIEDEAELNAVIAATDVYYAVYSNFRDSSNSLTKASYFKKPILVSDDYLMGERVTQYKLGAAVPYGDIDAILAALDMLKSRPVENYGFADYSRDHSVEMLKVKLSELLGEWLGDPSFKSGAALQGQKSNLFANQPVRTSDFNC